MKKTYSSSFILRNFTNSYSKPKKPKKAPSSNLNPRLKRLSSIYSNVSFRIPKTTKIVTSGSSSILNRTRRHLFNKSTSKSHEEEPMFTMLPIIPSISKIGHKRTMSSITTTDANDSYILYSELDKSHHNLICGNDENLDFRDFNPMITPTSTSDESRYSKITVYNQPFSINMHKEKQFSVQKFTKILKTPKKAIDTPSLYKPFIYKTNDSAYHKAAERKPNYSRNVSYSKITSTSQKPHEKTCTKLRVKRRKSKSPEKISENHCKIYSKECNLISLHR